MKNFIFRMADIIFQSSFSKSALRKTFPYIYQRFLVYREDNIKKSYDKYGLEALELFCRVLDINGCEYSLAFGTMLGAVREKGFIKHDHDIDLFIWKDNFDNNVIKNLLREGFQWTNTRQVRDGELGREDQFTYRGLNIDLYFLYDTEKMPYCCLFILDDDKKFYPRRVELPISRKRRLQDFETLKLYIPENAEEVCEFRYGPNYMIPDPDYNWEADKSGVKDWKEYKDETVYIANPQL